MLRAHVPRNLRVRQSIQIANTRVPARAFLIGAGLIFAGGLTIVVGGADLIKTIWLVCGLMLVSLIVFELRLWRRSTREVARILVRHYRRPHHLRCEPRVITLPAEISAGVTTRRPRWQESTTGE